MIQVKAVGACHSKNFSVFWVHNNRRRHLGTHIILLPFLQILLYRSLNIKVDGCHNTVSVRRLANHGLQFGVRIQVAVLSSVYSNQRIVVVLFNSAGSPLVIGGRKAYDITGQVFVRIAPLILILKPKPFNFVFIAAFSIRRIFFVYKLLEGFLFLKTHSFLEFKIRTFFISRKIPLFIQYGLDGIHSLVSLKILP